MATTQRLRRPDAFTLAAFDFRVVTFGSAAAYLAYPMPDVPTCLILDLQLPDMNGLDLQGRSEEGEAPQIVFLSGRGDVRAPCAR